MLNAIHKSDVLSWSPTLLLIKMIFNIWIVSAYKKKHTATEFSFFSCESFAFHSVPFQSILFTFMSQFTFPRTFVYLSMCLYLCSSSFNNKTWSSNRGKGKQSKAKQSAPHTQFDVPLKCSKHIVIHKIHTKSWRFFRFFFISKQEKNTIGNSSTQSQ